MDQEKDKKPKQNREKELKQKQNLLQREKRNKETASNFGVVFYFK